MYRLKFAGKILSFLTCSAISLGMVLYYTPASNKMKTAQAARTIAEIQEQRKVNTEKIAALEDKISALEGNKKQEKQQAAFLEEQITVIQDNINLLNAELDALAEEIKTTETNISNLNIDIDNQQAAIDESVELFKKRLCTMYMNSNDSSASIVLGSSSFYDMMSRIFMINSIAEHDDKLIDEINEKINKLQLSKKELEREKLNLSMKVDEQKIRKEEKAAEIAVLNERMKKTQAEIDRIAREQSELERDKAVVEAEQAQLKAEEDAWAAEIERQKQEAQRRWEEEQQKLQNSVVSPSQPVYIPVSPSESGFAWPTPGYSYISSYYGPRNLGGVNGFHRGIDIAGNIMGASIVASQAGTVIYVNNNCIHNFAKNYNCNCGGGYGNYVIISHDGTYSTIYGHMTSACVSVGDFVEQGQMIGTVGSTGHSTGAHLHFEVKVNNVSQNPLNYVSP